MTETPPRARVPSHPPESAVCTGRPLEDDANERPTYQKPYPRVLFPSTTRRMLVLRMPYSWELLGSPIAGDPTAMVRPGTPQWDVFFTGVDGQLWQLAWRPDEWVPSHRPDGESFALGSDPVAATSGDDVQVFARGQDGQLWRKVWANDSGWRPWEALGGQMLGKPAASGDGHLFHVFARGVDDHLYSRTWRPERWASWERHPEELKLAGAPAAASRDGEEVSVFARTSDGQIWTKWLDTHRWHPWQSLGGTAIGDPGAVRGIGRDGIMVFIRGTDNQLYQRSQFTAGGPWSAWAPLDVPFALASSPAAACDISSPVGNLQLYVRGADRGLWRKVFTRESFGGAPPPMSDPTAVYNPFFQLNAASMWEGVQVYEGTFPGAGAIITGPITRIEVPGDVARGPYSVSFGKPGTVPSTAPWISVASGFALEGASLTPFLNAQKTSVSLLAISTLPQQPSLTLKITYTNLKPTTGSKSAALEAAEPPRKLRITLP